MELLNNKIAIVTGGAQGFGEGITRAFVEAGAKVVVADLNIEAASLLAQQLGPSVSAVHCDVSNFEMVKGAVKHCLDQFGAPDIVVNNAGTTHRNQPMLGVDEKTFDRVFAVNVKSIYYMTQAVLPLMQKRKSGVILNVGSTAGIRPRPGVAWYNASKGAVNLLSKSMAVELAPDGIRVNAICPVIGATNLLTDFMGGVDTPEIRSRFISTIPLGRMCEPKDVGNAAVMLATDASAFLTGIELPVDGGRTI